MQADKKKVVVIGALVLVIVAIGAFQFTAGSSAPEPVAAKKEEPKKDAKAVEPEKEEAKNPLFASALPPRDPFVSPAAKESAPAIPAPPPAQVSPENKLPPMKLPPVEISKSGGFSEGPIAGGNAPVTIQNVPEPQFSYSVQGVLLGAKPMVVFADAQGNQTLVPLGGAVDSDSKVLKIEKHAVTVRFHGKTLRITVEGNPDDK